MTALQPSPSKIQAHAQPGGNDHGGRALRCLWLAREIPYPVDCGDRMYSANLAMAAAGAGIDVHYVGLGESAGKNVPPDSLVEWMEVPDRKRSNLVALFSRYPLVTVAHATNRHRVQVKMLLEQEWDAIVIDHYGSGWVLDFVRNARKDDGNRPVVAYLSHNHEESLSLALARLYDGSLLRRMVLYLNHLKIRRLERKLARHVDIVTAITEEDSASFARNTPGLRPLVLTPGYSGWVAPPRVIDVACPRKIVLVGSFRWVVKMENLRSVVKIMDPILHQHGITLDVVGEVPADLRKELQTMARATFFHGFVDDLKPYLQSARFALVPEVIGGGFKLKVLDYIFGRVPVATISDAAAGLPLAIQDSMLKARTLEELTARIVASIDNSTLLNRLHKDAFAAAARAFEWHDRGTALHDAIHGVISRRENGRDKFVASFRKGVAI